MLKNGFTKINYFLIFLFNGASRSLQLVLLFDPLHNLNLLLQIAVEYVRFPGFEKDQRRQIVQFVFFVYSVVGNLDQVHVGIVELRTKKYGFCI